MKKVSSSLIAAAILTSVIVPNTITQAASPTKTEEVKASQQELQQSFDENYFYENSSYYDKYILFNSEEQKYMLTENAKIELDFQEFAALESQLEQTNNFIKEITVNNLDNDQIIFSDPQQTESLDNNTISIMASYKNGVNKIVYHWWGTSVYVSKNTLNNLGTGVTIGGIWMPVATLRPIVATLGVVLGKVPGGLIFDRVYVSSLPFNNVRWQ